MDKNKLFLLDAYALIFRAYYALIKMPRLRRDGFNTSAVFGFVNTLEELLRKENPTHLAVCFDPAGPTFRSDADPNYKAQRESTPEDIKLSIPIIKEIIRAYNIPVIEKAGFEADDVIGTVAKRGEEEGFTVFMMTPDKDFGQLVSDGIFQYKPSYRGQDFEIRGEKEVCGRYGIERPSQVIDLLALMGDKVDNIPGCPGVGEKTAVKLIGEFGSVENLLDNTSKLTGALKKKVEENEEQIRMSRFLATIRTDVPVELDFKELEVKEPNRVKLFSLFDELEFRSLKERVGKRLDAGVKRDPVYVNGSFPTSLFDEAFTPCGNDTGNRVAPKEDIPEMKIIMADASSGLDDLRKLLEGGVAGVYTLADGENDMTARIIGTAVAKPDGDVWFVPAGNEEGIAVVLDIMAAAGVKKITSQAKREYVIFHRLRKDGEIPLCNYADVSVSHYLLEPEIRHSMDSLTSAYLGREGLPEPVLSGGRGARKNASGEGEIIAYACQRALDSIPLENVLGEAIDKEGMRGLLDDVELPLSVVLAEMEIAGVRIDVSALDDAARELEGRLEKLGKDIYALSGEEFNVSSPAKVGEILFDKLNLEPKPKKTKTGQYSTSEEMLEKVASKNPIVGKILEYRQLKKLLTTYLTALPAAINPATGKVHTVYNQTVTATGRISSSSPNLQNIPVREEEGRGIRRAFIADPGHLFFSADYSQIELRLVADFANDETMTEAFRNGDDIHAITAARIYGKSPEEVTADERRHAKTANFGILYGISAFGLANRLGIPRADAKQLIDNYFATFPKIQKYMSDSVEGARENGYVSTKMGRKRRLPDINSKNPVVRGYAERNAINAPVQGAAADIIKVAMVAISKEMRQNGMKSKMIMQVHDELNFDVVPEELPLLQKIVSEGMEGAYSGNVRLTASSGVAQNWLDAH